MIKIMFFDIDGTLLPLGQKQLSPAVLDALLKMQKKGIKLFLATGRPRHVIPKFEGIEFDGALAFNGQCCFDKDKMLYENPLDPEDVWTLYQNANAMHKPLAASQADSYRANYLEEKLEQYFAIASQKMAIADDFETYITEKPIFQVMAAVTEDQEETLMKGTKAVKCVRWWPHAADLIPADGGKDKGVNAILEAYGFAKEEAMAFGDGGNDKSMLEAVGTGVAMENGVDEIKEIADFVTKTVDEDGVVYALKHFGLL